MIPYPADIGQKRVCYVRLAPESPSLKHSDYNVN